MPIPPTDQKYLETSALYRAIYTDRLKRHETFVRETKQKLQKNSFLRTSFADILNDTGRSEILRTYFPDESIQKHVPDISGMLAIISEGRKAAIDAISDDLNNKAIHPLSGISDAETEKHTAAVQLTPPLGFPRNDESQNVISAPVEARISENIYKNKRPINVHIRSLAQQLAIPHLVHFTKCDNLSSILRNGLHSINSCNTNGIQAIRNDMMRLDGRPETISLSIAFPNYRMFYRYRQLDVAADWAVLILSPKIVWEKDCGFFKYNAADSRMRGKHREEVGDIDAFKTMFEVSDMQRQDWLRSYDPTDSQAEVMVYETIEPELIEAVAFETKLTAQKWSQVLKGIESIHAGHSKGLFASRAQVRAN